MPVSVAGSSPASCASLAARGVHCRPLEAAATTGAGAATGTAAFTTTGATAPFTSRFFNEISAVSIRRNGAPLGRMSPARACTAAIMPSHGASNSNTDLSLSSSAIFSPLVMRAPATTLISITVSSLTVAPMEGIGTSMRKVSIRVGFKGRTVGHPAPSVKA